MTRADLISAVQESMPGQPRQTAGEIVETVLETIKVKLEAGEDVLISGFGKFQVRDKSARQGRNPQTGKEITLDARRVVTFRPSPVLRGRINGEE